MQHGFLQGGWPLRLVKLVPLLPLCAASFCWFCWALSSLFCFVCCWQCHFEYSPETSPFCPTCHYSSYFVSRKAIFASTCVFCNLSQIDNILQTCCTCVAVWVDASSQTLSLLVLLGTRTFVRGIFCSSLRAARLAAMICAWGFRVVLALPGTLWS